MYVKNTPHILLGIFCLLLVATPVSAAHSLSSHSITTDSSLINSPCARPYDKQVKHPYMIHATWMYNRGNACEWQRTLEQFHRIGGKAVIQFGQALVKLDRSNNDLYEVTNEGQRKPVLGTCKDNGTSCIEQTLQDFHQAGIPSKRIGNWLSVNSDEQYSDAILCPGSASLDKKITVKSGGETIVYWRIVLPHRKNQKACDYTVGKLDVLFVKTRPGKLHEAKTLLQVADALEMDVYFGAPAFPPLQGREWMVDKNLEYATLDWSRRVFTHYARQYSQHPSFKGIYQTFEVALQPGWEGNEHKVYQQQSHLFHKTNPGKKYIISPYFMVNKGMEGYDLAGTVTGFKLLARAGIDIIIPQDGRGTGKGALYWPWQKNIPIRTVDPQLANYRNVKTSATFASQYYASSLELFRALKRARQELKKREGITVELWANVEAFDEDQKDASYTGCGYSDLSQTRKARVDRAITFSAGLTSKVAAFMYDPLFTCKDRYGISLLDEINADYDRPVITAASFGNRQGTNLTLKGHYLTNPGVTFKITWKDKLGNTRKNTMKASSIKAGGSADKDAIVLTLNQVSPVLESYIQVEAISPDGKHSHEPYSIKLRRLLAYQ